MKAEKHEGWEIHEDLAKKPIQWEPSREEFRTVNLISSKRSLHSIEMFIAYEAKFDGITRRLEALENKDPALVNQVSALYLLSNYESSV